ncbi:MAG: SRPBCC domain-containing protein [Bacteroidia bacterium]|nr:SRPBCC domain-containing protein [Bacteroidia bacterium]
MENPNPISITIEATVNVPLEKAWQVWTESDHIVNWNFASDDWHCPMSSNDLRPGGRFGAQMAAKDGSFAFEFWGFHDEVVHHELIASTLGDGRKMKVTFENLGNQTRVVETFHAESQNPVEMQRGGWQSILNNYKRYAESIS